MTNGGAESLNFRLAVNTVAYVVQCIFMRKYHFSLIHWSMS